MSQVKNNSSKKAGYIAGGALVALSSFVPQPPMLNGVVLQNQAHAAKVTVPVSGKVISGITLTAGAGFDFGSFIATATAGQYGVKQVDGGVTGAANGKVVVAATRGKFKFVGAILAPIDIKASKIGTDLALNSIGGFKQGDVTLKTLSFGKVLNTGVDLDLKTLGAATFAVNNGFVINKGYKAVDAAGKVVSFGGILRWTGARPIGAITNTGGNIVLTITY